MSDTTPNSDPQVPYDQQGPARGQARDRAQDQQGRSSQSNPSNPSGQPGSFSQSAPSAPQAGCGQSSYAQTPSAQPSPAQPAYGQAGGQPGGRPDGQVGYGQAYGQQSYGRQSYSQQPYGQVPYGRPGGPAYGGPGDDGRQYAQQGGQPYAGQAGQQGNPYGYPPQYGYPAAGQPYPPQGVPGYMAPYEKWNVMCIVGFVLAFVLPPVGLVLSIVALVQINKSREKSKGLSVAGIVIGAINTVLLILIIMFIGWAINAVSNYPYDQSYMYDDCSYSMDGECDGSDAWDDYTDDFSAKYAGAYGSSGDAVAPRESASGAFANADGRYAVEYGASLGDVLGA